MTPAEMTFDELRTVIVEREFGHSPMKLWRALTTPHLMAEWLMKTDFAPELGRRFTLSGDWGGTLDCRVLEIDPPDRLAYSWDHAHEDPAYALTSVVTFTLTPTLTGVRLRVEQTGFRPEQKQASGGARFGWTKMLQTLDDLLPRIGDDA